MHPALDRRVEFERAQRALRAVAIGRKNYLFAGSDAGRSNALGVNSYIVKPLDIGSAA